MKGNGRAKIEVGTERCPRCRKYKRLRFVTADRNECSCRVCFECGMHYLSRRRCFLCKGKYDDDSIPDVNNEQFMLEYKK